MPLIRMTKTHADAKRILLGGRYYNVDNELLALLKADRSEGGCFKLITVKPKGNPRIHTVDKEVDPEDKQQQNHLEDYSGDTVGSSTASTS